MLFCLLDTAQEVCYHVQFFCALNYLY